MRIIRSCALGLAAILALRAPLPAFNCYGGAVFNGKGDRFAAVFPDGNQRAANVISFGSFSRAERKFTKSVRTKADCLLGVSADGRTLAASSDSNIFLYSFAGELLSTLSARRPMAISKRFKYAAEHTENGNVVSGFSEGGTSPKFNLCRDLDAVDFASDEKLLAYACTKLNKEGKYSGNVVRVMDLRSGKVLREIDPGLGGRQMITSVKFSPDGRVLAYTTGNEIRFTAVSGWGVLKGISAGDGLSTDKVQFSADSAYFAAQHGTQVRLYSMKDRSLLKQIDYPVGTANISRAVFAPDNSTALVGLLNNGNTVKFIDLPLVKK